MGFVSPLVSRSVPLEGESSAFPLPTVALLPASPSRTPSCDQGGHPPWNPRCFAAANQQTRSDCFFFPRREAVAGETRMRSERARFLDRRERRAHDESSPFSALGENGRGFEATAASLPLSHPRTSSPIPFALGNKREPCPLRCGGLSEGLSLAPSINKQRH